jgi:hypothetical protein
VKKRRTEHGEERRKDRVEVNLMAEEETSRGPVSKKARGCALPFTGGLLVLVAIVELRSLLG